MIHQRHGIIRHGAKLLYAFVEATVPRITVILRKAYGMAGSAHANLSRHKWRYAWPSGDWGSLPISGGLEAAYKSDLEASDNPKALLKDMADEGLIDSAPGRAFHKMGKERELKFLWGTVAILAVIAIEIYVPNILPIFEWVTSLFERGGFFDIPKPMIGLIMLGAMIFVIFIGFAGSSSL